MKSDLVDLEVHVHHSTDKAILVSLDGDSRKTKWLPMSQIEYVYKGKARAEVTLPEWLAVEKGLV